MQLLTVSKSKEDYASRCLSLETEVLQLQESIKVSRYHEDPEYRRRLSSFDKMLQLLSDAVNSLTAITNDRSIILPGSKIESSPNKKNEKSATVKFKNSDSEREVIDLNTPDQEKSTKGTLVNELDDKKSVGESGATRPSRRGVFSAGDGNSMMVDTNHLVHAANPRRIVVPAPHASPDPLVVADLVSML